MKKKLLCTIIAIVLVIAIIAAFSKKTDGVLVEELIQDRNWIYQEETLREKAEHNWVMSETGKIECTHCQKSYNLGDEINYTPTNNKKTIELSEGLTGYNKVQTVTKENATWVVFGITKDSKGLLITTDKPINQKDNINFKGTEAYNNGIEILNAVARGLYSNSEYGFARGMTIEDINQYLGYKAASGQYSYLETSNGENKEIWAETGNLMTRLNDIPLYKNVRDNGSCSPNGDNGPKSLGDYFLDGYSFQVSERMENGYYRISSLSSDEYIEVETKKVELIFGEPENYYTYWLASRGTTLNENSVIFGMGVVENGTATNCLKMYDSTGEATEKNSNGIKTGIRPVVEIYTIE